MVHNRIAFYRGKYGVTQEELAEEINVTKQYVSKLERENSFPGIKVCFKVLKALTNITENKSGGIQVANIKLDDLFYDDEL